MFFCCCLCPVRALIKNVFCKDADLKEQITLQSDGKKVIELNVDIYLLSLEGFLTEIISRSTTLFHSDK